MTSAGTSSASSRGATVTESGRERIPTHAVDPAEGSARLAVLAGMDRKGHTHTGSARVATSHRWTFASTVGATFLAFLLFPLGALAAPTPDTGSTDNESFFTKVGDFASENATWFIIGLVALAVIIAAFLIFRASRKDRKTSGPAGTPQAAGRPSAAGPVSASEMKRRRRASMQRAREEERLRRKGARPPAAQPASQSDPVEAEKAAARGAAGPAGTPGAVAPPVPPVSPEAPTAVTPQVPAGATGAVAAGAAAGALAGRVEGDDAEQRLREKVEQIKAGQSGVPTGPPPAAVPPPPAGAAVPSLGEAAPDLADAERRLLADREVRDRTLGDAESRLRELEARAEAAERRAAFAEQLANLRAEEGEHERRLNEIVARIDQAEQRARIAEIRAEEAERTASEALRGGTPHAPAPGSPSGAIPPPPAPAPPVSHPAAAPPSPVQGGVTDINQAGFEELRSAGLSVTQATRVMAYRERFGGYGAVDDLARVPGFTPDVIEALRGRITT